MSDELKKKKKMGRPKIPIITDDLGKLEEKLPARPIMMREVLYWMDLGATEEEIAGSFYVSIDTLKRRLVEETGLTFAELREKCCGQAKLSLRNNQYRLSAKNASLAIWLGKIWLGQKDNSSEDVKSGLHDIRNAIVEILHEPRVRSTERPTLEDKQSILDKKRRG